MLRADVLEVCFAFLSSVECYPRKDFFCKVAFSGRKR